MLADQIKADTTLAMKAGDALRLSVLRMLISELNYKGIEVQRQLEDADVLSVLQKEAKKRREAIDAYTKAGRADSAAQEEKELAILGAYLPKQMSIEEINTEIDALFAKESFADFSTAMRVISPIFKNRADGGTVAKIVKDKFLA